LQRMPSTCLDRPDVRLVRRLLEAVEAMMTLPNRLPSGQGCWYSALPRRLAKDSPHEQPHSVRQRPAGVLKRRVAGFMVGHARRVGGALLAGLLWLAVPALAAESEWVRRHYGPGDGLPVSSASSARVDSDGFLWIATHDGLARFDGMRFDVHDSMRFPAMSGNRVQSLHNDAQGRVYAHTAHGDWLSVRSGHIERADLGTGAAQAVRHVDAATLCLTTATGLHCPDGDGAFPLRLRFPDTVTPMLALAAGSDDGWLVTTEGEVWRHAHSTWRRRGHLPGLLSARVPGAALVSTQGALWIAAHEQLFRLTDEDIAPIGQPALHGAPLKLREDAEGRIWVDTTHGVYRVEGDQLTRLFAVDTDPSARIHHISWLAPDGALWIRGGHRLWRFRSPSAALDPAAQPALETQGEALDLLFGEDGATWVMTLRDGVYRLNRARVTLFGEAAGLGGGNVYGVAQDGTGTVWLGTLGDGLKGLTADGERLDVGRDAGLPGDNPWLVASAPDGGLHVATYAPGLWQRPAGAQQFVPVSLPEALRGERVLSITFDAGQRLWLGTTAGAWRQVGDDWQRQWPTTPRRVQVNALAHAADGVIVGGAEGVWRRSNGAWMQVAGALLAQAQVRDLYLAADGALWISTEGRGLIRVAADDPAGVAALRLGRAQGLPSNSPHAVREDASGHLWVNSNQGIFRLAQDNLRALLAGTAPRLSPLVLGLADGLTELEGNGGVQPSALADVRGRLWFPSQRGVVRLDPLSIPIRQHAPRTVIDGLDSEGRALALGDGGALPVGVRNLRVRYGAADLHAGSELRFRHRLLPLEQGWTDSTNGRAAGFSGLQPGDYRFEVLAGNSDGVWADAPSALDFQVPPYWYETLWFRLLALLALAVLALRAMHRRSRRLRLRAAELDRQVHQRTDELRTEKARVESALDNLSEVHAQLAQTHAQIETSNIQLAEQARRLEGLDRFRSRLLADVSHELRTPVMLVSMPLRELHARADALPAADRGKLNLSLKQLDRLGGLVEQLVGLVQAESGQMPLRVQRLDLSALLRELIAGYQPMAARAGATLVLEAGVELPPLYADRSHLTTVFGNLIDNALKHAPPGSVVSLNIDADDERATVAVRDHGPGFDPALANHLFERFYRGEGPPRQGREGLGIGLALARELVELHGGRIAARSAPGQGATFLVELPLGSAHIALDDLALEASVDTPAPPASVAARGDGRALLVEDHPDLAAYLAERLGEHLSITCVGSAEAALEALAADPDIRLVISDVMLPGLSGVELCRQLTTTQAAPVILISAKAASSDRQAGLDAGALAYLAKPFSFETLLVEIARAWPASLRVADAPVPTTVDPLLASALDCLADAEFSITDWAGRVHLSERQLRRRVNELTGQSPQTWLREQRLLRVRQLIRSGECRTLVEAGARCGLDNPAYLYRSYRARFGDQAGIATC